jgi:hypothetical protein
MCCPRPLPDQGGAISRDEPKLVCQAQPELDAILLPYPISGVRSWIWDSLAEREYRETSNMSSNFKTY